MIMAIIGKINNNVLLDDCVLRKEPEVLTRWIDPTIEEKDKEIERLTAESTEWESKCYKYQDIINELEKYLEKIIADGGTTGSMTYWYKQVYNYLQELKEGKK